MGGPTGRPRLTPEADYERLLERAQVRASESLNGWRTRRDRRSRSLPVRGLGSLPELLVLGSHRGVQGPGHLAGE